jgi:WD40 repeat protein
LRGHGNAVQSAAFSPDGRRIVTASWDRTARVWDAATGKEITVLQHDNYVNSAAFSPDGARIVSGSSDNTARIWDVHFATTSAKNLLIETCAHWLAGISKLSRDDMRTLGYSDHQQEIDVCKSGEQIR